jgi:hypothetical protein
MSKKDFANKLAAGMRRAKQSPAPRAVTPAVTVRARAGAGVKPRRARQNHPSPSSSPDPWRDLHPARIWPD